MEKLDRAQKMFNFGAPQPGIRGAGPPPPLGSAPDK